MSEFKNTRTEKISLSECRKILSKKGRVYSDNEIISVRDLLYCFAKIDLDTYYHLENNKAKNTITIESLSKTDDNDNENIEDAA